jgi:hypothetical protein
MLNYLGAPLHMAFTVEHLANSRELLGTVGLPQVFGDTAFGSLILFMMVAALTVLMVCFFLISRWMKSREESRLRQEQLLHDAMSNPNIDQETLRELSMNLGGSSGRGARGGRSLFAVVALGIGWFSLFIGTGVCIIGSWAQRHDALTGGLMTALFGFAMLTFPFAIREYESRASHD